MDDQQSSQLYLAHALQTSPGTTVGGPEAPLPFGAAMLQSVHEPCMLSFLKLQARPLHVTASAAK